MGSFSGLGFTRERGTARGEGRQGDVASRALSRYFLVLISLWGWECLFLLGVSIESQSAGQGASGVGLGYDSSDVVSPPCGVFRYAPPASVLFRSFVLLIMNL